MKNMTNYNFGDVVLIRFPFTDQMTMKKRPAVIISSNGYQRERPDVILMAVTSKIKPVPLFGEVSIRDWREAGLLKPSVVKPIGTTIESSLVLKKLGHLTDRDLFSLRENFKTILGEDS